ncbi:MULTISPECIES: hypothetical protein [Streptomyces]|uniref:Uncharacterized protein n=2 Tax=Streptomyces TaxID=1883 RepID=A0ABV9IIU5_9ACTN
MDIAEAGVRSGSEWKYTERPGELIAQLDAGPVHLTGQDISGPTTFRVTATRPDLVRSYAAIETGLPGSGVEKLADVAHGGAWHIGVLAAPGLPEMLLAGRERAFLAQYAIPSLCVTPDAFTDDDIDEPARSYARPGAFNGAAGLYRSMLREGEVSALSPSTGSATMRREAPDRLADGLPPFYEKLDNLG